MTHEGNYCTLRLWHFRQLLKRKKLIIVSGTKCKNGATAWPELRAIALKLFTPPTSSATAESTFSTIGFWHNKLRNSLSRDTVERLTYIKSNHSTSKYRFDDNEHSETASEDEDFEELIEFKLL